MISPNQLKKYGRRFAIVGLIAIGGIAFGEVTITVLSGQFYDNTGAVPLPNGSLVVLVADTQRNGFGDLVPGSLNVGSFLNGTDDRIVGRFGVNTSLGSSSVQGTLSNATLDAGWGTGDPLALVWFSGLNTASSSFVSGQSYGRSPSGAALDGSDAWITGADGSTITLNFLTFSAGGSHADSLGAANLTAIPEPSTYAAVLGLGVLAFAGYRRRTRNALARWSAQRTKT